MGVVDGDSVSSGPGSRAMVRVRSLATCTGRIVLQLH